MDSSNIMPQRKYPRASFHDYNGGKCFVTACTRDKVHYFGKVVDGVMQLSALGEALRNNLETISSHYPDVEIPLYVVMPNHFHAVIVIKDPDLSMTANPQTNLGRLNQLARLTMATGGNTDETTHHGSRLGSVVAGIKAHVTRSARQNDLSFAWQPRYHEHIIRNDRDGNLIANYIETNPAHWTNDEYYE